MSAPRKATPRGQMSSSQNSGPAVMLMPPEIRSTFMPNPPLEPLPSVSYKRRNKWTGVAQYMVQMEKSTPPERILLPTPKSITEQRKKLKLEQHQKSLLPLIEKFRAEQKEFGGEYKNMNCYNTLFIGRLSYEVTEHKLLNEMEVFGPVKDLHIIKRQDDPSRSCGYAFVEYEHEDDMKRAYRAMDGVKIEGREVVVDVERGHTVPDFLPRRFGGGLGGTRLGSKQMNVTRPGRFDPNRITPKENHLPPPSAFPMMNSGGMGRGGMGGGPAPTPYGPGQGPVYGGPTLPPPIMQSTSVPMPYGDGSRESDRYGGGPSRDWGDRSRTRDYEGYDRNKRRRSRSPPDQRYGGGGSRRPRY
jgi:U1 small nuclear ribonucleoprotein 70kDa